VRHAELNYQAQIFKATVIDQQHARRDRSLRRCVTLAASLEGNLAEAAAGIRAGRLDKAQSVSDVDAKMIVEFWRDAGYQRWFTRDDEFDARFSARFLPSHHAAARREFEHWLGDADGALALMILLDQLPRNAFRDSAHAYATDSLARHYAGHAIDAGLDRVIETPLRAFIYLPFEHSEARADQDRSVALFHALGDADYRKYAEAHREVILRFGRFPHRNRALGRVSTPDEQAWLDAGGGFG
jgi:uncharacterized protein (DUF924 family)